MTALQSGNATQAQQSIIQANNTLNNQICEMPICNIPGGFVRSSEADTVRTPLKDAMTALQSGNATQAQQPLIQANQSLALLIT
jgi:hypothetical protein